MFKSRFKINQKDGYSTRLNGIKTKTFRPAVGTTNYGLKQLNASGPRIYALSTNFKNTTSLHVFLKKFKVHYISELIKSIFIFMFSSLPSPSPYCFIIQNKRKEKNSSSFFTFFLHFLIVLKQIIVLSC